MTSAYPSAAMLVEVARPLAAGGRASPATDLAPLYLRSADIRINWEQREGPVNGSLVPGSPALAAAGRIAGAGAAERQAR